MRDFFESLTDIVECRNSCDELCSSVGLTVVPLPDPHGLVASCQSTVATLQAAQALVRVLAEGQTRESLASAARTEILSAKLAIPSALMSLLEDPKRMTSS
jgi:hypothetical protein